MKVVTVQSLSSQVASLIAVLVSAGVLASLGFQQGGPGQQVTDYVGVTSTAPAQAGNCVAEVEISPGNKVLIAQNTAIITGQCDSGMSCSPTHTCQLTSNITNNPLANGCGWAKTVSSVQVGNCDTTVTNKNCEKCNHLLVCHVYELFEGRSESGTCVSPCGKFLVKYGGTCVYNGTP